MGAFITPLASCLGTCCGAACCKLATVGSTQGPKAARCLLWWLNFTAVGLAFLLSHIGESLLGRPCTYLRPFGMEFAICECPDSECFSQQLVYRTEASVFLVLLLLLIMTVSGCSSAAARDLPVLKFMMVPVLVIILLFVPNSVLTGFAGFAAMASAGFLILQTLLLIDFGYRWNTAWFTNVVDAQRENDVGNAQCAWQTGILGSAALLLIIAIGGAFWLWKTWITGDAESIIIGSMMLSLLNLVLSITDWCEHGALLTSALIMAYGTWLSWEALSMFPQDDIHFVPCWASLLMASFVLGTATQPEESTASSSEAAVELKTVAGDTEAGEARGVARAPRRDMDHAETWDFTLQCVTHALFTLYICGAMGPAQGMGAYVVRIIALFFSILMYGWTLVAPKVLENRSFY